MVSFNSSILFETPPKLKLKDNLVTLSQSEYFFLYSIKKKGPEDPTH